MIISFSVSNYRSFAQEQTLSMVASKRQTNHTSHLFDLPGMDEKALRLAIVYGANGAGKSNLCKALRYLKAAAIYLHKDEIRTTGREAFRLGSMEQTPTMFDLQFLAEGKLYRYGLSVDDQHILEEWLVRMDKGSEFVIFERVTDNDGAVRVQTGPKSPKKNGVTRKFLALATVGAQPNQSFLATVKNMLPEKEWSQDILAAIRWFDTGLEIIHPEMKFDDLSQLLDVDDNFRAFGSQFLKSASTGVSALKSQKKILTEADTRRMFPDELVKKISERVKEGDRVSLDVGHGMELCAEKNAGKVEYYLFSVSASHLNSKGDEVMFSLSDESDGTNRLLHLLPALYALKREPRVFVIDEIDRSLHPMLSREFLDCFLSVCKGQMILTTHETHLLDQDLVRRDEIWFSEKSEESSTHLYSLNDFKVRTDLELRKGYLQGRFGAIPFLGDIRRIIPAEQKEKQV